MKLILLSASLALIFGSVSFGQVGIGTATPNIHAVLDLKSPGNNQGLLIPGTSNAQRLGAKMTASLSPNDNGLLVFDTDDNSFYYWNGAQWDSMLHGAGATPVGSAGGDLSGSYPNPTIGAGKVTSATIADGSITDLDISTAAAIQDTKLATLVTAGKVSGNAIISGTISGSTIINTTGSITAASITAVTTSSSSAFTSTNSATVGGTAISGLVSSTNGGYGIYGQGNGATANKLTTFSYGVYGKNNFSKTFGYIGGQYGIYGENPAGTGIQGKGTTGISGNSGAVGGVGVYGSASGAGSYGVYSNGAAGGTTTWNASSDRRFKRNISTLQNSLEKVLSLRGVSFNWRTDEFPDKNFSRQPDIGFIAQEIREILPQVVLQDKEGYFSVSYEKVVPLLIEAIKDLHSQIRDLKKSQAEFEEIKSKIAILDVMMRSRQSDTPPLQPDIKK